MKDPGHSIAATSRAVKVTFFFLGRLSGRVVSELSLSWRRLVVLIQPEAVPVTQTVEMGIWLLVEPGRR